VKGDRTALAFARELRDIPFNVHASPHRHVTPMGLKGVHRSLGASAIICPIDDGNFFT
jgi:hypothetical protein